MRQASPRLSHKDFWDTHDAARPSSEDWERPGTTYGSNSLHEDFPYIMEWDDSGAAEALSLARRRQDAMARGFSWTALLPQPGMYLDKINWDVQESWDLPDSADSLAAREDKRFNNSRSRGCRNHGRWRNQETRNQDYRSREVEYLELPMQDVSSADKNMPLAWGDPLPVPTGWGDVAVDHPFLPTTVGGGWNDAEFPRQAAPCSSTLSQGGPSGWGGCRSAEDHAVSTGWGDHPVSLMQSPYDRQQVWTSTEWPAQHTQPSTPLMQQQQQRLLQQQQAHSQALDVRWQNRRYPGQSVPVAPDCGNGYGTPFQESLPCTLQQHNFQDRLEVGGGRKYHRSQHYGWDGGGAVENRGTGHRNMRDRSGYRIAPPPAQDVWKQQRQPVANIGHGTGVYY